MIVKNVIVKSAQTVIVAVTDPNTRSFLMKCVISLSAAAAIVCMTQIAYAGGPGAFSPQSSSQVAPISNPYYGAGTYFGYGNRGFGFNIYVPNYNTPFNQQIPRHDYYGPGYGPRCQDYRYNNRRNRRDRYRRQYRDNYRNDRHGFGYGFGWGCGS